MAGQGAGKSHGAGTVSGYLISKFPDCYGFIGANTYTQLSDSTLKRIRTVWRENFGWSEYTKANPEGCYVSDVKPPAHFKTEGHDFDSYHGKMCFAWGTVVFKGSLDNYKAHDGKEFAWAILDETKDTKEEAVKEVILGRLRQTGMTANDRPWNPLFIFTSPAKVQWINEWFHLAEHTAEITASIYSDTTYFRREMENKLVVISSTYHNKKNLPENYIENQKLNLPSYLQDMLIYGNPFSQMGGEFYKCFSRIIHVQEVKYNPALPLHISFDFNVNPYMTCTIWQIDGKNVNEIDEICLPNPNNTTPAVCKEFTRRYMAHNAGLFIYGDPAGDHEDTRVEKRDEKKYNDFRLITKELEQFRPNLRVDKSAPPVVMRGNFINTILEKEFEGIKIIIGNKCVNTINDFLYLKEASDGRKHKEKETDQVTKVSYERYGHTSDSADYLLCYVFRKEFLNYQLGSSEIPAIIGSRTFNREKRYV